ncbi:hypothetical protein P3X46_031043 [Hevea brasiliensis]|uniref:5-formyltetrahydrofolate cyclo-ligase n=1 Tax=Hevea brasiliensis TaxID=3981 RepID=A0ABQ9KKR1_HEVBR|nr:hypothetical protein P3X46_031043 [Hevea brasiliensis]
MWTRWLTAFTALGPTQGSAHVRPTSLLPPATSLLLLPSRPARFCRPTATLRPNFTMSIEHVQTTHLSEIFKQKRILRTKIPRRLCAYISCSALYEDKNSHMRMLNISSMDDLNANSMNILEPAPVDHVEMHEKMVVMQASDPVDLFLLPVALSYFLQIMDGGVIPVTLHDLLVDALVTPSGMIPISPSALERSNVGC